MKKIFGLILATALSISTFAEGGEHEESESFNAADHAIHHALDAHEIHISDELVIPLPIILWTDNGLVTFMSSEFHHDDHGHHIVERDGMSFVKMHEKIYQLDSGAHGIELDAEGHPANAKKITLDFSITKNVVAIFLVAILKCDGYF